MGKWVGGGWWHYFVFMLKLFEWHVQISCYEVENNIKILVFSVGCQLLSKTDIPVEH